MTWDGTIPESAWQRREPTEVILAELSTGPKSSGELVLSLCHNGSALKQAIAELGDRVQSTRWKGRTYYRLTTTQGAQHGQGPQETLKP